jgi:hypothetical protein
MSTATDALSLLSGDPHLSFFEIRSRAASIELVHAARRAGAQIELHLIGDGPECGALIALGERLGAEEWLRFLDRRTYGPELLEELAEYDALLFTPLAEG